MALRPLSLVVASGLVAAMVVSQFSSANQAQDSAAKPGKLLRHVVLLKFKEGVTPAQVTEVTDAFSALPGKIPEIVEFEWGTDVSVEKKTEGYTHCFFVSFKDEKGRETYIPHPAHADFGKLVGPRLDKVLVVDYWSRK